MLIDVLAYEGRHPSSSAEMARFYAADNQTLYQLIPSTRGNPGFGALHSKPATGMYEALTGTVVPNPFGSERPTKRGCLHLMIDQDLWLGAPNPVLSRVFDAAFAAARKAERTWGRHLDDGHSHVVACSGARERGPQGQLTSPDGEAVRAALADACGEQDRRPATVSSRAREATVLALVPPRRCRRIQRDERRDPIVDDRFVFTDLGGVQDGDTTAVLDAALTLWDPTSRARHANLAACLDTALLLLATPTAT